MAAAASGSPVPLVRMDQQQDPALTSKQMQERSDLGVATGGVVGVALMAIVAVCAVTMSLTPFGFLLAIGISFVALIACMVAGNVIAKNWEAIMGFFGKQPKASP